MNKILANELRKIANNYNGVAQEAEEISHKAMEVAKEGYLSLDVVIADNKFEKNQLVSLIDTLKEEGFSVSTINKPEELVITLTLDWSGRALM